MCNNTEKAYGIVVKLDKKVNNVFLTLWRDPAGIFDLEKRYIFSLYCRYTRYGQQYTVLKTFPQKRENEFSFLLYCTKFVLTINIKCT